MVKESELRRRWLRSLIGENLPPYLVFVTLVVLLVRPHLRWYQPPAGDSDLVQVVWVNVPEYERPLLPLSLLLQQGLRVLQLVLVAPLPTRTIAVVLAVVTRVRRAG